MVIEIINDKELWDKFVDESQYGLLFHKWNFLKIIEKHSNYKLLSYGIYKGDELVSIFPLFIKKFHALKLIFSPPPKTGVPYLGFLTNKKFYSSKQDIKENYLNIVADEFNNEILKHSPNYIYISMPPNFLDIRSFKWNNFNVSTNFTYAINLDNSIEFIWNDFKKELRKQIKQAEESNFKLVDSYEISGFYEMERKRYEEQGRKIPLISKRYLEDLLKAYPENLKLYYLNDSSSDDAIGALITHEYKRFILWMGNTKIKKSYGNEYIIWELIKRAKKEKYQKFEIIGANNKNLCQFKAKFNPSLEINFNLNKKDNLGKIGEWFYLKFMKQGILQ